jgi:hypothetical protein
MAGLVKVSIKGGRELEANLRSLGKQVTARAVGRRGLAKAAEPIRDIAKALAPDDPATGTNKYLKESIKIAPGKSRDKDQIWVRVGIDFSVDPETYKNRKSGGGSYRDPGVAGVGPMMEFGVPARNIAPRPFMRPAWEVNKAATPQRIVDAVKEDFEKTVARAARRRAK